MVEEIRQGDIPGVQLRYRHPVEATEQEAWSWLTEPDRMSRWLASDVVPSTESRGALLLVSTDEGGRTRRESLTHVGQEPPHRWVVDLQSLSESWPVATRVTFELTCDNERTEISVLQQGFAQLPLSDCLTIWEGYRRRWRAALATLAEQIVAAKS